MGYLAFDPEKRFPYKLREAARPHHSNFLSRLRNGNSREGETPGYHMALERNERRMVMNGHVDLMSNRCGGIRPQV